MQGAPKKTLVGDYFERATAGFVAIVAIGMKFLLPFVPG
jgi:hypothetical protein